MLCCGFVQCAEKRPDDEDATFVTTTYDGRLLRLDFEAIISFRSGAGAATKACEDIAAVTPQGRTNLLLIVQPFVYEVEEIVTSG